MPEPIIEVENISKLYRLGVIGSTTLQESVERWWYRMRGKEEQLQKVGTKHLMIEPDDPQAGPEPNSIWALRDVSFSVQKGEIVGIIGKNGAGKSTLLKILTRITEPTSGRAIIRGRIASLLEVGTGFHPELTGRENVYLNGAILGMQKAEIDNKFDEIVDFSEIENFIDTPVKRYSSGMYVRLAFAVAAHLEPEILLVDEVLAVGDFQFQKKCLGKMKEVSEGGRTVLFVSHNMGAIQQLTTRCLLLNNGKLIIDDNPVKTVEAYVKNTSPASSASGSFKTDIDGFCMESIKLDKKQQEHGFNKPLKFDLHLKTERDISGLTIGLQIINSIGARIMTPKIIIPKLGAGDSVVTMLLENHYLPPGYYTVNVGMSLSEAGTGFFYRTGVLSFEIPEIGIEDPFLTSRGDKLGVCLPVKYHVQEMK